MTLIDLLELMYYGIYVYYLPVVFIVDSMYICKLFVRKGNLIIPLLYSFKYSSSNKIYLLIHTQDYNYLQNYLFKNVTVII